MSSIGDTLPLALQHPEPIAEQLAAAILSMIEDASKQDAGMIGEFVELPADAGGIVWTEGDG